MEVYCSGAPQGIVQVHAGDTVTMLQDRDELVVRVPTTAIVGVHCTPSGPTRSCRVQLRRPDGSYARGQARIDVARPDADGTLRFRVAFNGNAEVRFAVGATVVAFTVCKPRKSDGDAVTEEHSAQPAKRKVAATRAAPSSSSSSSSAPAARAPAASATATGAASAAAGSSSSSNAGAGASASASASWDAYADEPSAAGPDEYNEFIGPPREHPIGSTYVVMVPDYETKDGTACKPVRITVTAENYEQCNWQYLLYKEDADVLERLQNPTAEERRRKEEREQRVCKVNGRVDYATQLRYERRAAAYRRLLNPRRQHESTAAYDLRLMLVPLERQVPVEMKQRWVRKQGPCNWDPRYYTNEAAKLQYWEVERALDPKYEEWSNRLRSELFAHYKFDQLDVPVDFEDGYLRDDATLDAWRNSAAHLGDVDVPWEREWVDCHWIGPTPQEKPLCWVGTAGAAATPPVPRVGDWHVLKPYDVVWLACVRCGYSGTSEEFYFTAANVPGSSTPSTPPVCWQCACMCYYCGCDNHGEPLHVVMPRPLPLIRLGRTPVMPPEVIGLCTACRDEAASRAVLDARDGAAVCYVESGCCRPPTTVAVPRVTTATPYVGQVWMYCDYHIDRAVNLCAQHNPLDV